MSEMTMPLSDEFSVLAFYGINHSTSSIERFFDCSKKWFESLGHPPDKLGVSTPTQEGNISSFSRVAKQIQRSGFLDVSGFEMYATVPEAKVWWSDCFLSADYEGSKAGTHAFVTVRTSIASLDDPSIKRLASEMVSILEPMYGIGFTRMKRFGPGMYVVGILKSPPGHISKGLEYEEDMRICRWGDEGMIRQVYRDGLIRDVYPQNYLNSMQVSRRVGDVTLEQWIHQDNERGTLSKFSEGISLWSVNPQQIESIRAALRRFDIVFDWKQHQGHLD